MKNIFLPILYALLCVSCYAYSTDTILHIEAIPYDSHILLNWQKDTSSAHYLIYINDSIGQEAIHEPYYVHFPKKRGHNTYRVASCDKNGNILKSSLPIHLKLKKADDEALMDMIERHTADYFIEYAHRPSGMAREGSDKDSSLVTVGGSGMGVMAIIAAASRNWITREEAYKHILSIVSFLSRVPRFYGMWAHWYDGDTGEVVSFSQKDDGGDVVESALMMQGLLCARAYFDRQEEVELRDSITTLWEDINWEFYTRGENVMYWHYSQRYGFEMNMPIKGYNEALIAYILAASSPSHPIKPDVYHDGWASWDRERFGAYTEYYGVMLPLGEERYLGGPLFFAHYSFLGLCPVGLRDRYAMYWEQNVRHTMVNRAYCIDNPYDWEGYGESLWGITACYGIPDGYMAHAPGYWFDRGVIAPTAAVSSMPYTPTYTMEVIKNLYRNYGEYIYGRYGFYDAIKIMDGKPMVRQQYLAIDQAPQVVMIENHRTGLLWRLFMSDKDISRGLSRLGFTIDKTENK